MRSRSLRFLLGSAAQLLVTALCVRPLPAADVFVERVAPFLNDHCVGCHNEKKARGDLDLRRAASSKDVVREFRRWSHVIEFIRSGEMPPEDEPQPDLDERARVVEALESILLEEARAHAGDPGRVLPRRLSHTEFDRSVHDLTGIDTRPTSDFPPDPAAGEGFDNTGEALTMSPSLLRKYLAAAQRVSTHLVLQPDGISFAPFPVTSYAERRKLTEETIIAFYANHRVNLAAHLEAAWRSRHRSTPKILHETLADESKLSSKYLAILERTLTDARDAPGWFGDLGRLWLALPPPAETREGDAAVLATIRAIEQRIEFLRRELHPREERLIHSDAGNWPIAHLALRERVAQARARFDRSVLSSERLLRFHRISAPEARRDGEPTVLTLHLHVESPTVVESPAPCVILHRPLFSKSRDLPRNATDEEKSGAVTLRRVLEEHAPEQLERLGFGRHVKGHQIDPESICLEAPSQLQISLSSALLERLQGMHLLTRCTVDRAHGPDTPALIRHSNGEPPDGIRPETTALLVANDSPFAIELEPWFRRFCEAFPSRFFHVDDERGLAAGFHLVEGFFRDDRPLVANVLDTSQQDELDALWADLEFVTRSTETLLQGFVWFERSERHVLHDARFDFLRPEDPRLVEEELLSRFERVYLEKLGVRLQESEIAPEKPSEKFDLVHGFFGSIREGLARHRARALRAEREGLEDLDDLARRAYRRELLPREVEALRALYHRLRKTDDQDAESAMRGVLTALLLSPEFLYHYREASPRVGVEPLSSDALASRLSFFLWSSIPDESLLQVAREDRLKDESVLASETERMRRDPRIVNLAREFFGQWLRFRDFLERDSIQAAAFDGYDDALRSAMFEEPVRLATYLVREDRPITELLEGDFTFVNRRLAEHYGGEIASSYRKESAGPDGWQRVDGLRRSGRGGLFGMAVVLTLNSAGERTSAVKRGFWTAHHLLGQHFPPPPADVPELPATEREAERSLRELLAAHAADARCAMCHDHFDGLGLALEGFDPIGRSRTTDLAGRPVEDLAAFPDGSSGRGVDGLIQYVTRERHRDFVRTLCRKLLGYALGRSVLLSDRPLLDDMERRLDASGGRFSVLLETIVLSPQFRNRRGEVSLEEDP